MSITDFLSLMPSTVTVKTLTGVSTDGYGTATFSTGTSYRARVVHKMELVKNSQGIEELARTVIWLASTSTFSPSSQFVYPTSTGTVTDEAIATEAPTDTGGVHHVKVFLA